MINWSMMFEVVQEIVQSASSPDHAMQITSDFAIRHQEEYTTVDFWSNVRESPMPNHVLSGWMSAGFERLSPATCSLVMLDCGDAPDNFHLNQIPLTETGIWETFENFALSTPILKAAENFPPLQANTIKLCQHMRNDLNHMLLHYPGPENLPSNEASQYLFWLMIVTFAMRESLRDPILRANIVTKCPHTILMSGYEEIFFYVGTITKDGMQFNIVDPK